MSVIRFGTGAYESRSRPISSQQMINCYLEVAPPGAKSPVAVIPSYGIDDWCTVGAEISRGTRGGVVVNGIPYVLVGRSLAKINSNRTASILGEINTSDLVSMAGDGTNIVVASEGDLYLYNGSTVSPVSDPDFPGAAWVGFLDGYFPIIEPDSGRLWINETPYVPTNWNALDFVTAEGAPDDLLWGVISQRELYAFGRETIEVFYNSGDVDSPLRRTDSGFIELGLMSAGAAAKTDNGIYLLANDGIGYRLSGYEPTRVSAHAMEKAIEDYADKTCRVVPFTEGGHKMVAFQFATATWVIDLATQLPHERKSMGYDRWRPQIALPAFNRTLVGDVSSNRIGVLDPTKFEEWGEPLRSSCTAPPVGGAEGSHYRTFHNLLELQFEHGVGTLQTPDPQVMLDWSDDDGRTWSSEHWRSLGAQGAYKSKSTWRRLGRDAGFGRVYRYAVTDKVRRNLIQAVWEGD